MKIKEIIFVTLLSSSHASALDLACYKIFASHSKTVKALGLETVTGLLNDWRRELGPAMDPSRISYASKFTATFKGFHEVVNFLENNPDPSLLREVDRKFLQVLSALMHGLKYSHRVSTNGFSLYTKGNPLTDVNWLQPINVWRAKRFVNDVERFAKIWTLVGFSADSAPRAFLSQTFDSFYHVSVYAHQEKSVFDRGEERFSPEIKNWFREIARPNPDSFNVVAKKSSDLIQSFRGFWGGRFDSKRVAFAGDLRKEITLFNEITDLLYREAMSRDLDALELESVLSVMKKLDTYFLQVVQIAMDENAGYHSADTRAKTERGFSLYAKGNPLTDNALSLVQLPNVRLLYHFAEAIDQFGQIAKAIQYENAKNYGQMVFPTVTYKGNYHLGPIVYGFAGARLTSDQKTILGLRK